MKKIAVYICFFQCLVLSGYAQQSEIDLITQRLTDKHLQQARDNKTVKKSLETMKPDGSWDDIDYISVTGGYPAATHLDRLINMTLAYRQEDSGYNHSTELQDKILSGIDYFFKKRPVSANWWYQDIGAPQKYMVILLLLKDKVDKEKLHYYASYLEDKTGNKAHKGKNRTWVSAVTIYKGCIEDRFDLISTGFYSIASTIKIVDYHEIEGIKIDNSIHQHRPQLYSGGYGMSFIADLAEYIALAHGTGFSQLFTSDKMKIIRDVMLEGQQLFGYRDAFDFGAVGRNISREDGVQNLSPDLLDRFVEIDPGYAEKYRAWKNHLLGGPFPEKGNKYFWKSDIMTRHGSNYYLSAKVISVRTNGTEMLNGENTKGYYLPLGATNIMTSGKEYKNIFPIWDWTKVPGTTAVSTDGATALGWYHFGSNRFAGGVSNGEEGCIAFDPVYNGVEARKAYFFMGDAMLCLGTGIRAYKTNKVITTVNQCYAEGPVYLNNAGTGSEFSDGVQTSEGLHWVWHDRVGYVFPQQGKVTVQRKQQSGSWSLINRSGSDEKITRDVFSLWFEHGEEPQNDTYCYIVLPDVSAEEMESRGKDHGFTVLKNEAHIQAVQHEKSQTRAIVFYEPGTWAGADLEITSDKEALVLIKKNGDGYECRVADPLYTASEIKLTFQLPGKKGKKQTVHFKLPQGEYTGSTITQMVKL